MTDTWWCMTRLSIDNGVNEFGYSTNYVHGRRAPGWDMAIAANSCQDSHLALVHIPNDYYHFFTSAIFRVLFNDDYGDDNGNIGWTNRHDFLNLSITPVGCSLFAPTHLVDRYFRPVAKQFNNLLSQSKTKRPTVEICNDEFLAVQVDGQGLDAAQRVLELTGPLAMAGM